VFAGIANVIARIAPEAAAVTIVGIVFKFLTQANRDDGRWRRLMLVVIPLLNLVVLVVLLLTAIAVWWPVSGGADILLRDFGPT
jgi:mannose/fructose/N-acetylgalactosamine-specific phosphotransferase system component IIC